MPPKRKPAQRPSRPQADSARRKARTAHPAFLLEVGCEELPPRFCMALDDSDRRLVDLLKEKGIVCRGHAMYSTPRRIVFHLRSLQLNRDVLEREVLGPPKHVGIDAAGRYT
ncbi:MAG: glycine--tRNA ligase subunit beta, partial [bacterium]